MKTNPNQILKQFNLGSTTRRPVVAQAGFCSSVQVRDRSTKCTGSSEPSSRRTRGCSRERTSQTSRRLKEIPSTYYRNSAIVYKHDPSSRLARTQYFGRQAYRCERAASDGKRAAKILRRKALHRGNAVQKLAYLLVNFGLIVSICLACEGHAPPI